MPRPTGLPKTGGRTKGVLNKRTQTLQEMFDSLRLNVPEMILELLPKLSPVDQANVLMNFMKYLYPTKKAIEHKMPSSNEVSTNVQQEQTGTKVDELKRLLRILEIDQLPSLGISAKLSERQDLI